MMVNMIKEENWNTNIANEPEAFDLIASRVELMLDQIIELSKVRTEKPFEYPVIVSFLASYCLPNCAVPNGYLSQFEYERVQFASTGLTA